MKTITSLILILLFGLSYPAVAQQDPDDPGIQDSVIVQTVSVDQAMRSVLVDIFFVTDDSVSYVNLPLLWTSENDSICPSDVIFPEDWGMAWFDTIMPAQHRINITGFRELGYIMDTHCIRENMMSIQFQVESQTSQIIAIDSTWDDRNGSVVFGLSDGVTEITPAFVPGGIIYSPQESGGDPSLKPNTISLLQNYPNPFNAQTTISYSLAEPGPVTLTIYNLLGQKVATLFDGIQPAGEHKAVWDASNMTSGVYFARLNSKNSSHKIFLTLIK
jgi:hypothetical protein